MLFKPGVKRIMLQESDCKLEIDSALILLGAENIIWPMNTFFSNKVIYLLPLEEKKCMFYNNP